ncbi:MAG: 16S rRNA (uracil(1498)-N(3))-methyltransferase, partial [Campylobacteraceae bacterium]|nr:16S rRNA (uracil(1498)-N(3))-methyltransferase [Campylobacteraceae bacterium]
MQFLHNENAGDNSLLIKDESYRYLIKARRHKLKDLILFRNLEDNNIYTYEVFNILKKEAVLNLIKCE